MSDNLCWDDHLKLGCADATDQRAAWAEVTRLREIVGQLERTADNVPWIPTYDCELWRPGHVDPHDDIELTEDGWRVLWFLHDKETGGTVCHEYPMSDCYSTREAADAAAGKET